MTTPLLDVSQYTLHVDARDTVQVVMETSPPSVAARALDEVLRTAANTDAVVAVAWPTATGEPSEDLADDPVTEVLAALADSPRSSATGAMAGLSLTSDGNCICLAELDVAGTLRALSAVGLVEAVTLWQETSTEAYLSAARIVTAVHVLRPFALLAHDDGRWERRPDPRRPVDDDDASEAANGTVPVGWYLLGEIGDICPDPVGVAVIHLADFDLEDAAPAWQVAERLTTWLVELDGFGASRCHAGCSACGRQWFAEAGSWRFMPDTAELGHEAVWDFDDADGFDEQGTIECPICDTGRVGVAIT